MKSIIISEKFKYFLSIDLEESQYQIKDDEEIVFKVKTKTEEEKILNLVKKLRPELFDSREFLKNISKEVKS